jgi:hypothetical protein
MCFLDKTLAPEENNILKYSSINKRLINESILRDNKQFLANYQIIINIILRLTYLLSTDKIVEVIDCAYKHDFYKMLNIFEIGAGESFKEITGLELKQIEEANILHRMIFVTTDLTKFIDMIKSKGYTINGGPQARRAEVNEMEAILTTLDAEFREAFYYNYMYNVSLKTVQHVLSRKHFSFKNIHMKLGELKY